VELAPRFTYAASLPLSLLTALGTVTAWRALGGSRVARAVGGTVVTALLAGLAALTVRDIGHWRDDLALWSRVIELQPHRFGAAYAQRALFLAERGEYRAALSDLDEALAIAQRKRYGAVHEIFAQRGRARLRMGDLEGAVTDFGLAMEAADDRHRAMYLQERAAAVQRLSGPDAAGPGAARAGGR
jgi:tetratricopeptide (TPR) repeat protein